MSIASAIQTAQGRVAAAYTACNSKGATMPSAANQNLSNLATTIETISTGGGGVTPVASKDVDFLDYDGTVVYSYSAAEFAALSSLPANPSHTGLTAQGWNWTLSDAKTYVAKYRRLDIGQSYITDDGKTRLYITLADDERLNIKIYWYQSASSGVTINWGDNTSEYSVSSNGNKNTTHTYTAPGNYIITFTVNSGNFRFGNGAQSSGIFGYTTNSTSASIWMRNALKKIEIGSGMTTISAYTFQRCISLTTITIPNTVTTIAGWAFGFAFRLVGLVLPIELTSIGTSSFETVYSLTRISFPKSCTSLGTGMLLTAPTLEKISLSPDITSIPQKLLGSLYSVETIIIPSGVTSIGGTAFNNLYSAKAFYFYPTTPPTLGSSVFSNLLPDCVFYVPNGQLNDYQTASNWSRYASIMVEMPA